jgi:holo-[acyl-carrier protein] synthase
MIGVDLVALEEVRDAVGLHGDRYLARVFTAQERAAAGEQVGALAERVAVKEAAFKALRPDRDEPLAWRDVELADDRRSLRLSGRAAELARERGFAAMAVSVSRIPGYASAVVVAQVAQGELR